MRSIGLSKLSLVCWVMATVLVVTGSGETTNKFIIPIDCKVKVKIL